MGIDWENIYEKIMLLYVKYFDSKQIANNINTLFKKSEEKNKQIEHTKKNFWMKY